MSPSEHPVDENTTTKLIAEAQAQVGHIADKSNREQLIANLADTLEAAQPRIVRTVEELDALPVGAVIRSIAGTIACRVEADQGTVFGDDRPFGPWNRLHLPITVLWVPVQEGN
jgi:hypothetical protein